MVDFQSRESRTRTDDESEASDADDEEPPESEEGSEPPEADTTESNQPDQAIDSLGYAIVTVTGKRSMSEDTQGNKAVEILEAASETISTRELIQPSYDGVQSALTNLVERGDVDAVVTIGGTGVEPADVTVEALDPLFDKELPGFGELFRRLTYEQKETAVVGTRTTAGIVAGVPVFVLPGTVDGVVLGTTEIIVPEARSLAKDASLE
jgi:molybdenum cofactor biosynthesis protein B